MKKIEIFLRHCYYSKLQELPDRTRPSWFNKIKVFENFKNTLNPNLVNYTIVYDEFYGSIDKTFLANEENVEIINCGSECNSFLKTLDIIQSKNFDNDTNTNNSYIKSQSNSQPRMQPRSQTQLKSYNSNLIDEIDELEELNNVFTSNVITIEDWRQYITQDESNNGKKVEIAILNYLNSFNIQAKSTRGQGLDITIGNKIIDVKSSEKNNINTQLQTSFYTNNPNKFYIFVTNTKNKDIKLRIISSQILYQISLGYNIFNELHTYQQSNTLDKEIKKGLKTLDFNHFITTSITQGKSADTTKSFKVGNDIRVRFVIYIEPK
jgi:hypothetical protein